jgi:hypothetical protein
MSLPCIAIWLLLPLILVIGVISWATESRPNRIRRMRQQGSTWATIATRYGVSPTTVRRWAAAA